MRALALGAAALLETMIPISHDHMQFNNPEDLIWTSLNIYQFNQPDVGIDPVEVLNANGREAFLLLDEFQNNFCFAEDDNSSNGKKQQSIFTDIPARAAHSVLLAVLRLICIHLCSKTEVGRKLIIGESRVILTSTALCMNC